MLCAVLVACGNDQQDDLLAGDANGTGVDQPWSGDEDLEAAESAAAADRRLAGFVRENDGQVRDVYRGLMEFDSQRGPEGVIAVEVQLGRMGDEMRSGYPLDVCAPPGSDQPITGVIWLVMDGDVHAVSPIWGESTSCFNVEPT